MESDRDHSFWTWLVTGETDGDLEEFITVYSSGDEAERRGKLIFKRFLFKLIK